MGSKAERPYRSAHRLTQTFAEARESLSRDLRPTFDSLCEDVTAWSTYYYGGKLISYSILKELVNSGWKKQSV
jgi:hypothetical protein